MFGTYRVDTRLPQNQTDGVPFILTAGMIPPDQASPVVGMAGMRPGRLRRDAPSRRRPLRLTLVQTINDDRDADLRSGAWSSWRRLPEAIPSLGPPGAGMWFCGPGLA